MYILINKTKTEVNENYVTSNRKAKAPKGWTWIKSNDTLAVKLLLAKYKTIVKKQLSETALEKRAEKIPDYKLVNASLGIYDITTTKNVKNECIKYRNKYYEIVKKIDIAKTKGAVDKIVNSINWE